MAENGNQKKALNMSNNSIRSSRNVGKVVISREMGLEKSKAIFFAKISWISFSMNLGPKRGPPKGPLLASYSPTGKIGATDFSG